MDSPSPRSIALGLALVAGLAVAVGLTAGVVPADRATLETTGEDSPAASTVDGDPPYLSPADTATTREEYAQPGIDISTAAAADAQRLRGQHAAATFEEEFDIVEDRTAFVEGVIADLGARAEALDEQHAELVTAYGDGEVSTETLLGELVRLEAAAVEHRRLADRVKTVVSGDSDLDLFREADEQFEALGDEILALESPVTDAFAAGEFADGTTVYAQAGEEAIVLAVSNATHFERQATLRGERNRSAVNQFIEEAGEDENANGLALERAETLYGADNVLGFFPPPYDATTVYGVQGTVAGGEFVAYLDGTTENIFHEQQTVAPAGVPVTDTLVDSAGGLELTVNTTVPTGPMRVSVTDGGDPVEGATVQVNNQTAGTTDASGQDWVVQPRAGAELRVTLDEETLRVTLP
jgi:hypothetical protein